MQNKFFKILLINIFTSICVCASYCQQVNYSMELGAFGGGGAETSGVMYNNIRPVFGGMLRYKFDKRWALRLDGGAYNLYSSVTDAFTLQSKKYTNSLIVSDLVGEFNFLDYEDNPFNRKARRFTTYIFAGIGGTTYEFEGKREFQPLVPLGVGFKFKIAPRWNLNIQYIHHISFTDRLDGIYELSDINEVKGANVLNKDMLSAITIGVTFDFWRNRGHCFCD